MSEIPDIAVSVAAGILGAFLALCVIAAIILAVRLTWKGVAFVIGWPAGAVVRHTPAERRRRAAADELAAREATRPHGQLIDISTVLAPNGHEAYFEDPAS